MIDDDLALDLARRTAAQVMVDLGVAPDLETALAVVDDTASAGRMALPLVTAIAQLVVAGLPAGVIGARGTMH